MLFCSNNIVITPNLLSLFTCYLLQNDLNLVLCLFILTGFPQIKSPGVSVRYLDYGSDEKEAVILKHFPDRLQSMLIDTTTRKRKMVSICHAVFI